MIDFKQESSFDLEMYQALLRRIRYDDRDAIMYENMLKFLWEYVIEHKSVEDKEGIYQEYVNWNEQMIEKVLYHAHDIPYANIRRCYQSVVCLLKGDISEGISLIEKIGKEAFSYDGKAPKTIMTQQGRVYRPMSKLFILYNYMKYCIVNHLEKEQTYFEKEYEFAFHQFNDQEHEEHDRFLKLQMEHYKDCIVYPVFEKVYKIPWGPKDFYLYYEEESFLAMKYKYIDVKK